MMFSTISVPLTDTSSTAGQLEVLHVADDAVDYLESPQPRQSPIDPGVTVDDGGPEKDVDASETGGQVIQRDGITATAPDLETLAARMQTLLAAVLQVEQLSRDAREAAASDLAHYDAMIEALWLLERHREEAARVLDRAEKLAASAFGEQARAAAAPAVVEACELERMLRQLVELRTAEATTFKMDHPDVEALVEERRLEAEKTGRQQLEVERARRIDQLVQACELALDQGGLVEARECLRRLEAEFPAQEERIQGLRSRLHQRVQAGRDGGARTVLARAGECLGRGDLEAALAVVEQVDVRGLSPEVNEDVFGLWSQCCSRLAQSAGFDQGPAGSQHQALVRFAPTKGRGLILMRDRTVPHGLVVFSSLGMGPGYPRDRIVSDRLIVERARGFRRAAPLAEAGPQDSYARWNDNPTQPATAGVERR
jgi:hypothetical protein